MRLNLPSRIRNPIPRNCGRTFIRPLEERMPPQILMPALSPTMEEGKLAKWHVKVGDPVKSGDVIAEIETDKATMEVEAVDDGKISQLLVPEGAENVKVNTPIAVIDGEGGAAAPSDAPKQQAVVKPAAVKDTTIPEGTEMVAMTVREALRDAMREEMKRNPDVFLIGEEVGQYQGAYKISQGLLEEFGPKRVVDTPI